MKEKLVAYGSEHPVTVEDANKKVIIVIADDNREAFVLIGHGLDVLPQRGDKGKIVFERDASRGHWQYYPTKKS